MNERTSYQKLVENLAARDLEQTIIPGIAPEKKAPTIRRTNIKIYEPKFWSAVGSKLGMGNTPPGAQQTYRLFNEDEKDSLYMDLGKAGTLRPNTVRDLSSGLLKIPALEQLALSSLPTSEILELDKKHYGFWPIPAGKTLDDLGLEALKRQISHEQIDLLRTARRMKTRNIVGLWLKERDLVSPRNNKPINDDYLPNLTEMLYFVEKYFKQEKVYPHTKGGWLLSRSILSLDVSSLTKKVKLFEPDELLWQTVLANSLYSPTINNYAYRSNDEFYEKTASYTIQKNPAQGFKIEDTFNHLVHHHSKKNNFISTTLLSQQRLKMENGNVEIKDTFDKVVYQSPVTALIKEIENIQLKMEKDFSTTAYFELLFKSDTKDGINLGVFHQGFLGNRYLDTIYSLAGDNLKLSFYPSFQEIIESKTPGFKIVHSYGWPKIYPDTYAPHLLKK